MPWNSRIQIQEETAMYPKVWLDDGKLKSIADKRHTALVFREKIYLLVDLIRMKIFKEERIKDLDFIKKYGKHIRDMFTKYARLFTSTPMCDFLALQAFYLNLIKMRQMECHAMLSDTCYHMDKFRAFLSMMSHVRCLNEFIRITTTTARFLENYITKSKTFDV